MRRAALLTAIATLAIAAPAGAASTLTIRGAGFGHGVGMSQYGAAGMAAHGWDHTRILAHYFTDTTLGQTATGRVVRVLLASPRRARFTGVTDVGTKKVDPSQTYGAEAAAGGRVDLLDARGRVIATFAAPMRATNAAGDPVQLLGSAGNGVTDGSYRGWLEFRPGTLGDVLAINAVGLEQYVAGVIANEAIPSWPMEALEAQAVATRSYAIATSRAGENGWDQYPDTRSQVYRGVAGENPNTNRATNATAGQVVLYDGRPAVTYFFSTSGGETEDVENVWPGATPEPYLRGVADPFDGDSPYHRWKPIRMSRGAATSRLGGLVKGTLKGIRVTRRGVSPRVVKAVVVGSKGSTTVTGEQLKARFGLRDTWMTFNSASATVQTPAQQPAPAAGDGSGGAAAARHRRSRVVGSAFPGRPGAPVVLQRRAGSRWVRAGATHLRRTHRYRIDLPGPGRYRIVVDGAPGPVVRPAR